PQGLRKTVKRRTFKAIMALVNTVAEVAEAMDHHPDIFIHEWNRVTFTIITHSERAVTDRDLALARKVEAVISPSASRS
ncbi:MAG: 4a-hydroxytetrahydrobiopterin dehydratase, partial [Armatimonadetes bacterium]|nr:4a-hydroxytetrahydrobiopterin dehydratase [Armatimonadota bacterium]